MAAKKNKTRSVKKRKRKRKKNKKSLLSLLRQWFMPFFLFLIIGISLAAAFYMIFLHTPATPLF